MPETPKQVITVIFRRLPRSHKPQVKKANAKLREAAHRRPGYLGARDTYLPAGRRFWDLVTVYTFASQEALDQWEADPDRKPLIDELDRHCLRVSDRAAFDGLRLLQPDSVKISKHETVLLLIVLILAVGRALDWALDWMLDRLGGSQIPPLPDWLPDWLPQSLPDPLARALSVTVSVCLISYLFLPWSIRAWVAVKARLFP